jgi:hypothetical protein
MNLFSKLAIGVQFVNAQSFLPEDWEGLDYWQDNTYCTTETDDFLVFELTEDPTDQMATRDGCNMWCSAQADYYGATCCGQAFFGTYDESYFVSYCALYNVDLEKDGQVDMPIMDDGSAITAFSSTLMPKEGEDEKMAASENETESIEEDGVPIALDVKLP